MFVVKLKRQVKNTLKVYLKTKNQRAAFVNAILKAQGYNSELDQYTIGNLIERTNES